MTRLVAIFSSISVMLAGSIASAGTFDHFDRIAVDIERQATQLVSEARHFRHTPQYRHLAQDALVMLRTARHAHVTAHLGCNLAHLDADVRSLDRTLHHIEGVVAEIEHGLIHGRGHAHGNARHIHELLHAMEANIHHLQSDLRQLRSPVHVGHVGHGGHGGHSGHIGNSGHGGHGGYSIQFGNSFRNPQRIQRSPNAVSRRVPAGWGNHSLPRYRIGIGF